MMSNSNKVTDLIAYQIKKDKKVHKSINNNHEFIIRGLDYFSYKSNLTQEDKIHDILKITDLFYDSEKPSDKKILSFNKYTKLGNPKSEKEVGDMNSFDDKLQSHKDVVEAKMEAQESRLSTQVTKVETKIDTSISKIEAKIDASIKDMSSSINDIKVEMIKLQNEGFDKIRTERKEDRKFVLATAIAIASLAVAALSIILN